MRKSFAILSILALTVLAWSCKKDGEPSVETLEKEAIANYAAIVYASYEDSYNTAVILKQKIDAFVAAPTAQTLEDCKTAWKAARIPYGQTEAFRFYGGPIDDANGPEGLINSWPLDESYIDYVQGNANAGLINKTDLTLTKQTIESLNQTGGATEEQSEVNVATGYHAIEFLLWGQDFSTNGPGNRPYTDYVAGTGGTAKNQARRGQYLKLIAELLVDNLAYVKDQWKTDGAYRTAFLKQTDITTALKNVFTGLGELSKGELAGERMIVAAESKDQENEHSCFSDNTHIDIQMNFKGIQNGYFGKYTRVDGSVIQGRSFAEIVEKASKTKATAITAAFQDAETKISQIPTPFDQAIVNSSDKILTAAEALSGLSDKLVDGAFDLGVRL
jgi:putative iron-regulated protein